MHQNFFQYFDFSQMFFFFNCTWISKQYSVLSEHKLSCIHEKVCNTLSLSAYTCSTADGSLILIISITQMICLFWPKIWKWILPIQWLSFSITFFLEILYAALACCENWDKIMLFGCVIKNKPICLHIVLLAFYNTTCPCALVIPFSIISFRICPTAYIIDIKKVNISHL